MSGKNPLKIAFSDGIFDYCIIFMIAKIVSVTFAAAIVCLIFIGGTSTAYAANVGGVAIGVDGSERPLTQEELLEHMNAPEVTYKEDGTVWVYFYNQKIDITDKFDENGICYVKVSYGDETIYMTVEYQNGWSTSKDKYINPSTFN